VVDHVTEIPLPGRTLCGVTAEDTASVGNAASADHVASLPRVAASAFIAGPENRVAASAINRLLALESERTATRILSIYGVSGTGKTHLARGLVQSWQERDGSDTAGANTAEYFTAADFRHALADAIKSDTVAEFRNRVRGRKLLAIDDIDRLPSDANLQHELRSTIDALEEAGAMLVVTSSSPSNASRNLSVDIRSRLAAGLELRLAPPEEAARQRLAQHVSAALGRPLSTEAAERLAAAVTGTAREVFGAMFELQSELSKTIGSDVRAVERFLAGRDARRPVVRDILATVAKYYRIPQKVLKSSSRRRSAVSARAMAIYLARELAGLSYDRIGEALGGRDHTTIMHSYRKIADALGHDAATRDALADLERQLLHTAQPAA
jgi:chromosomal replication initiator protein